MIGAISAYGMNPVSTYGMYGGYAVGNVSKAAEAGETGTIKNPGESTQVQPGKKSSPAECQTCKERKYQDGSNEMVSFKSASHISPEASGTAVRAHEQEHVSNAYKSASQKNGKVISCSVSIKTAVCPECGRSYVAGGTTQTAIKYSNESNPYVKNMKSQHGDAFKGSNIDMAV